jgi:hypothetical protein
MPSGTVSYDLRRRGERVRKDRTRTRAGFAIPLALAAAGLAAIPLSSHAATARHQLSCPSTAPTSWNLRADARLVRSAVLGARTGIAINDGAPPYLMPDQGYRRGGAWHNVWLLDEEPGWAYFVECQYLGSRDVLRLKADGLNQCEQVFRPNGAKTGGSDAILQTMQCD